ncbi:formate dehydrogenase [Desulfuromonas versatilis]|uniref:Formate dehydrogenase n=1 Tax=Desulfuromonas versatilis TaxID=2802975 RepID=A0ABM8HTM3_9BACT|nr:molybdopterin oxidoreductase family protein [Desulfuromonas versatilis]BCR03985.1 formate dehydrogenase [Desulfuromonas versatilis]
MKRRIERSVCPYDCPDTCGMLVEVEGDRAVAVSGDPEHPYTRGVLCPKMNRYQETVHNPRRLTTPLRRTGPKGSGEFAPISWEDAIGYTAFRWRQIIEEYGAEAILPYSYAGTMGLIQRNAGHPFFHRLGASQLLRSICSPAKEEGWKAVMGSTPAVHPDAVELSDLVILWGIHAAATSIHFQIGAQRAKSAGARVWAIDTWETSSTSIADRVVLVRPGSDGALALGLMHILVREELCDEAFLAEQVQGFAELKKEVLPAYDPRTVSELTGVSAATLEEMAKEYGLARAPLIRLGSGLSRYGNGAMTVRTIVALPALVGAYGKLGAGCLCGTSTGGAFAIGEVLREDFMERPTRIVNMNRLGEALNGLAEPPVMALYVYHSNPAAVAPDQNQVLKGLCREELFTVVHERFMTDTARYADIVLPATSSLEHADIYRAYGSYCIQRAKAVIPPVGQSKSNWEVFGLLAEAMGFEEPFFGQSADQLIDHLLSLPTPMRTGIDEAGLAAGRGVELKVAAHAGRYGTPSGKIEILNPAQPHPLPRYLPVHGGAQPLRLMTAPTVYALNASFYERDELRDLQEGMCLLMNREDAEARGLADRSPVVAYNDCGEVEFVLRISDRIPAGVVVAEGVWWLEFTPGARSVNALTSQRLTDQGEGSTFYDNTVEVRPA